MYQYVIMKVCECPYEGCGRNLSTRYNLRKHIEAHHLNIRPYECSKCHRTFSYKHSLKHHYLLHIPLQWQDLQRIVKAEAIDIPKLTSLACIPSPKPSVQKYPVMPFLRLPEIKDLKDPLPTLPSLF